MNLEPRRRVRKPKCKTGCKTCKKRRVKCDEGKPQCARCVKFWGQCDGYDDLNDSKVIYRANIPILPAPQRCQSPEILADVSTTIFQNEQEHYYFQTFLDDIAPRTTISARFGVGSLLTLVLPRACWTEPALRHGFVALGALSMTQPNFQLSSLKRGNSQKHYRYALEQYQKAIRSMRALKNTRTILLATLLIFCFEMGNDRRDLAIWQMENGIQIFRRWLGNCSSNGVLPMASPAPGVIEDDIMLIFRSMSHRPGNVTIELDWGLKSSSKNDKPNGLDPNYILGGMPAIFSTVEEARYFLEVIGTNTVHFFQSQKCADPVKNNVRRRPDSYYSFFSKIAKDLTEDQLLEHESCMSALEHWLQASKGLLIESQAVGGSFYNRMACLRAAAMSMIILQARVQFKGQYGYDRFLPLFREIVTLQWKVLDSLDHKGLQYGNGKPLDEGINLNIFLVAVKCRHRSLRREVISLLRRANRREGLWDSAILTLISEFLMRTEEGDSDEEVLPEKSRVSLSGIAVDSQRRKVFVEWVPYSSTGEKVYSDTWLSW